MLEICIFTTATFFHSDISSEGIGVKIAAPDREGEANYELIKFLSSV